MSEMLTVVLGVGQLSVLVEIARRMGRLRSDMTNVRTRVEALEEMI